ncbi:DsrH/TusB family sulfur metabolism protein [Pseudoalteromonas sp. T1lg65]|uniref:DsrH/TusB family sulfur metabolism protein n=1 Tax=Pseudoalteromonas sp. T1lg65 TaxID=2077101 RepID=UPI003F79DCAD
MTVLHIVNSKEAVSRIKHVSNDDTILLCDDGCFFQLLLTEKYPQQISIVMLETCAMARGVTALPGITLLSDQHWVDLTISSKNSITW